MLKSNASCSRVISRSADIALQAGREYHVVVDTLATTAPKPFPVFAMAPQATQVGFFENLNTPLGEDALALARPSHISIVFTANNKEYESKSFDRETLFLSPLKTTSFLPLQGRPAKLS